MKTLDKIDCEQVWVECYHCGHVFDMDLDLYIRALSVRCPECEREMAKDPNEFCEELVHKDWLRACWEKQHEETSN